MPPNAKPDKKFIGTYATLAGRGSMVFSIWPSSLQHHPETSIPPAELWPWRSPLKDRDLVPQGQNFQRNFVPTSEQGPRVDHVLPKNSRYRHKAPPPYDREAALCCIQ